MKRDFKILVVDDDQTVRRLLSDTLGGEGYEVTDVARGEEALIELGQHPYPLVLLDLVLPGAHGIRILHDIKRDFPMTDVIIMTSHASLDTAVEALRLGAQDYLIKPFEDLEMVVRVVMKTYEKRQLMEENERLYKELKAKTRELELTVQRLSSLTETGQALHSILDLRELLQFFVRLVATELGADRVSLMLLNKKTGELVIEAAVGLDERLVREVRIRVGEGIAGWVVREGKPLLVEDIEKDPKFKKQTDRDYSTDSFISAPLVLSVPIKFKQEVLGVINVNNKQKGGVFSQNDLEFVSTLASQAALAIENARIFEELKVVNRELKETHFEAIMALAEALEAKDASTGRHSDRLLRYAMQVAEKLGLTDEEKEQLRYTAVLHDIGKIGVPERILQKTGRLTPEEYEAMKSHPQQGAKLLRSVKFLATIAPVIQAHHERYDGTGYPAGLRGEAIPIQARIVAVLDAYDAMTSDRPYRKALPKEKALEELRAGAVSQFDPKVVEALLQVLSQPENVGAG